MNEAVEIARKAGVLGVSVLGSPNAFDMEIRVGAGAYVCGEETSLLECAGRQARRGARQAAAAGASRACSASRPSSTT